jgi:hypothetical protein
MGISGLQKIGIQKKQTFTVRSRMKENSLADHEGDFRGHRTGMEKCLRFREIEESGDFPNLSQTGASG